MAYLDYVGLAYFKSLLDENYLRTNYEGDTVINGNVTFTNPVDASVKNDWLGQQIDKTYIKNLRPEDDGEVALIYGDNHEEVITIDTAVTQVRSDANEMYPILLCYDANAEVNQISKSVRYGHNVAINPAYGYVYANSYVVKHPTYNRTISATSRVEWASDFRDSVLNPVGQIFEYIDPVSQGGEHRMELRLYGNPNVAGINTPNINDETNTVSLGVSATRGDALTFFGYAPSTPIYLEDGSTMRKSLVRGDQYGKDIITRDWLNLNGSITGLVHTYMDETIDGYKTFLKTVTIDSGDDNNKAGLNVQGDVNIDSGDPNKPSDLHVQGNADIDGDLNVDGDEQVHGDLTVDSGDPNDPSHIYVQGEIYHSGENGEDPIEYVSYITNQQEFRTEIVEHLLPIGKGLAKDSNGKIYVDFSQIDEATKANILSGLDLQKPLNNDLTLTVNPNGTGHTDSLSLDYSDRITKPFNTISKCVEWATSKLSLNKYHVIINVAAGTYNESVNLPAFDHSSGYILIQPSSGSRDVTVSAVTDSTGLRTTTFMAGNGNCHYVLSKLIIHREEHSTSASGDVGGCIISFGSGSRIDIRGCLVKNTLPSGVTTVGGSNYTVRLISADSNGSIYLQEDSQYSNGIQTVTDSGNKFNIYPLVACRAGQIFFSTGGTSNNKAECSGSCNIFAYTWQKGSMAAYGSDGVNFSFTGSMSGTRYTCNSGGTISTPTGSDTYFPGDSAGSVSSSTYSWYE